MIDPWPERHLRSAQNYLDALLALETRSHLAGIFLLTLWAAWFRPVPAFGTFVACIMSCVIWIQFRAARDLRRALFEVNRWRGVVGLGPDGAARRRIWFAELRWVMELVLLGIMLVAVFR